MKTIIFASLLCFSGLTHAFSLTCEVPGYFSKTVEVENHEVAEIESPLIDETFRFSVVTMAHLDIIYGAVAYHDKVHVLNFGRSGGWNLQIGQKVYSIWCTAE